MNSPLISVFPKMRFSMVVPEVQAKLKERNTRSVVLFGIEAHVCVLQTALDLLEQGIDGALPALHTFLARTADFVTFCSSRGCRRNF